MRQQVRAVAAGALLLTAFVVPTSAVHAATARLSVAPHKVKIGRSMIVSGTSLPPRSYVTFLLAVPNSKKPLAKWLLGPAHVDGNGRLKASLKVPPLKKCGAGTLYALLPHASHVPSAHLVVSGCGVLPPPPSAPGS